LINNAAVIKNEFNLTSDKIETTLQTNVFSPMILTQMLTSYIQASNGKVINLTGKIFYLWQKEKTYYNELNATDYDFEKKNYSGIYQYSYTKLGTVYFTKFLHNKNIRSAVVHPGVIETGITRDLNGILWSIFKLLRYPLFALFSKTPFMGAQTILHLCYAEENNFKSGEYYEDNQVVTLKNWVMKDGNLDSFMSFSKRIIDHYGKDKNIEFIL
jgi:NAD(P)-dependent dehydrogenase (short-subunit alcohol dehydrogenase family)